MPLDYSRAGAVDIIKELKACKDTLIVFGAGLMAKMVIDILKKHDIQYGEVCADHVDGVKQEIENCVGWDEINRKYDHYSVIVAHAPNLGRIQALKKEERVRNIYFFHSYDQELFDPKAVAKHSREYAQIFDLLQDAYSKDCITAFLNTKLSGDMQYMFDVFQEDMNCFVNSVWSMREQESFWDIGACTGNLIQEFITVTKGKYRQIVALEPDKENFKNLQIFLGTQERAFAYHYGAWYENGDCSFVADTENRQCGRCAMGNEAGSYRLNCISLDSLLENTVQLSHPTLLRFNYRVGVKEALRGAARILNTYQPKLAICIGFDETGFVDIIHEIRKINPNYKFYIRFQRCLASSVNLYAL